MLVVTSLRAHAARQHRSREFVRGLLRVGQGAEAAGSASGHVVADACGLASCGALVPSHFRKTCRDAPLGAGSAISPEANPIFS
jgi:hypothetical protein